MQTPSNFDFIAVAEQSDIASDRREFLMRAGTGLAAVGMLSTTGGTGAV